jgi:serine/threonine-protein kinase
MASPVLLIHGRYQLSGKPVGQGGMGVVYKAYDVVTKRYVALKSMRGELSPAALDLFNKEWSVLASLSHPNIVDVLDTGEFEQDNERRPFFVMPFLPGTTLDQLLANASTRLTLERILGIVSQTCRGLQAAHERGVIHRDLKPSNIFVMDDDAVKIIDFGIVHLVGGESVTGIKGTLQYMAPEQLEMKPSSPASDVFSLAVVCYEALTGRKPFARRNERETVDAIRRHIPPATCDLNPLVSRSVSRVIHKAMAKDPWHRFSTAKEFSDTLQKALRGEPLERFDLAKIQPRIDRAKKAHAAGDHEFALEILSELEAEGNIDPEMSLLRIQIDQVIREKSIRQLLESARTRLEEEEFPLALQKIQEVLDVDPDNPDAVSLRSVIEKQRSHRQIESWFRLVDQHIQNGSFSQARRALEEILKISPNDSGARALLADVDRREEEVERTRTEKEQLYQGALSCYQRGEVSSALTKLERILELTRRSPDTTIPDRDAQYQSLYNQIRTERDAARSSYAEGRRHLADRNFGRALEICTQFLKKNPGDPMFQALKLEAEERQRQDQSAFIADVSRRAESEHDLDRRVNILKEAVERYPEESHLQQSLRLVRERRDLVNSIVERARQYEERGQFNEALSQFDILRNIHAQYPGIEFETDRLRCRRDVQIREESKGKWVEQIDRQIALGVYGRARELVRTALTEFPEDRELIELERVTEGALTRAAEAEEWLRRGQQLCFDRQFGDGLEALRKATALDDRNPVIRASLLNALVEQARSILGQDWRAAEPLIQQALSIDGGHPLAKSLQGLMYDYKRQEIMDDCVSQARGMQANGDLEGALTKVEEVLASYPNEVRLVQLRATLRNLGPSSPAVPVPAGEVDAGAVPAPAAEPAPLRQLETVSVIKGQPTVGDSVFGVDPSMVPVPDAPVEATVLQSTPPRAEAPNVWLIRARQLWANIGRRLRRTPPVLIGWAEPMGRRISYLQWALIASAPVLLALAFIVTRSRDGRHPAPASFSTEYVVDIGSNVANAKYRVDGKAVETAPVRLSPGEHTIEAFVTGYKPAKQTITLTPNVPKPFPVPLKLEPELVRLRLSSGLKSGQVKLDDHPPVELQEGSFGNDDVSLAMEHIFSLIQAKKDTLTFSFRADPGGMVQIPGPIRATDVNVVLITTLGSNGRIFASNPSLKGGLKDSTPQPIPALGLELHEITPTSQVTIVDGKSEQTFPLEVGNSPTLLISLADDPNLGTLQVDNQAPGVEWWTDGRKPSPLRQGKTLRGLPPGPHVIYLMREGFEPVNQTVEVKKGELLPFRVPEWKAVVRSAYLAMEGATPGAQVLVDGVSLGSVADDGSFKPTEVAPGSHRITLGKPDFESKQLEKRFEVGKTIFISGLDGQLIQLGSLEFRVDPVDATITYKRAEEAQAHAAENRRPVSVRAGSYVVTATANGYHQNQETVPVEAGRPNVITWNLLAVEEIKAPPPPASPPPSSPFQDPATWTSDGIWRIHKSTDIGWMRRTEGVFQIEFPRQGGIPVRRKIKNIEWVLDQRSSRDRIEYSFDFGSLERKASIGGKVEKTKVSVSGKSGDSYSLQIEIGPEQILIRDAQGKELDRYQRPNRNQPVGRFGFKGEVVLSVKKAP